MRILLIAANMETEPYPVYPLGMAAIAEALTSAGHDVAQFDRQASNASDAALAIALERHAPELVGISLRNIDNVDSLTPGSHWSVGLVRELVRLVKARTQAPVVLGGAGFSLMPEAVLEFTGADYGVVGEGERSMVRLADAIGTGNAEQRLWREERHLAGEAIRAPRLDDRILKHYLVGGGLLGVQTKRGCTNVCAYCTYPLLDGRTLRMREPGEVADELERLRTDHGVDEVFFTDSVFNDSEGLYLLLAEELARRQTGVAWSAYFQPLYTTPEDLALLRRAGLKAMEIGTDAACDATLRGLNKGFCFDQAVGFNAMCVEQRVPCAHFVIFGGPDETPQTVEQGLRNLAALGYCVVFAYLGIRLYAETALFRRALRDQVVDKDVDLLEPTYYFSPDIDPQHVAARLEEAFRGQRDRFFPPSRSMEQMTVMRRFGYKGLLWDTLIRYPDKERSRTANAAPLP